MRNAFFVLITASSEDGNNICKCEYEQKVTEDYASLINIKRNFRLHTLKM